ncbi:N-acetylglucosamine/diacetylchitobiose ABC transporter substrate-binding protein [Streptomyces sp. MMS24-I2-30]|uniref:N-acetylglucosamine/diacetylchitobiose ABC transporter substrate-binding protein n=1 Tax=Streptomyces sp. MMS24-I2-30 TaxID=3351564 RepID=UPI0038968E4C
MGSASDLGRRDLIKRTVAAALAASPASALLTGCATAGGRQNTVGKGKMSEKNPFGADESAALEVVVFDGGLGVEYVTDAEAVYERAFPKTKVKHTTTQDIRTLLQPRFLGGDPPDLVDNTGADSLPTATLADNGQLTDLRTLLKAPSYDIPGKTVAETLIPGVVSKGQYGGEEVWALNYAYTAFGVWYSKSLLEKYGWTYPRTWDEMLTLCAAARKEGIAGWTYAGKFPYYLQWTLYPFIAKIGGWDVLKSIDNLEPNAWKHPAVRQAFEAYHELVAKGYVLKGTPGLDHTQSQAEWIKGKALFVPNGTWVENETEDITPAGFEMTVSPPSGLDSSDVMPFETIWAQAGEAFVVPKDARNPQGGLELLRIMLGKKSAQNFSRLTSSLSCVRGAVAGMDLPSGLASASRLVSEAGSHIISPRTDWYQTLNREEIAGLIGEMMADRLQPAEAIDRIQKASDAVAKDDSVKKYKHP